jgi:hypothetical protein
MLSSECSLCWLTWNIGYCISLIQFLRYPVAIDSAFKTTLSHRSAPSATAMVRAMPLMDSIESILKVDHLLLQIVHSLAELDLLQLRTCKQRISNVIAGTMMKNFANNFPKLQGKLIAFSRRSSAVRDLAAPLLKSERADVRRAAASTLAACANHSGYATISGVIDHALDSTHVLSRVAALRCLEEVAELAGSAVLSKLTTLIYDSKEDQQVRETALCVVSPAAKGGYAAALILLIACLEHPEECFRQCAACKLGEQQFKGNVVVIAALAAYLKDKKSTVGGQEAAARVMGKIGKDTGHAGTYAATSVIQILRSSAAPSVLVAAAESLAAIADNVSEATFETAAQVMVDCSCKHASADVRAACLTALVRLAKPKVPVDPSNEKLVQAMTTAVKSQLRHKDAVVCNAAIRSFMLMSKNAPTISSGCSSLLLSPHEYLALIGLKCPVDAGPLRQELMLFFAKGDKEASDAFLKHLNESNDHLLRRFLIFALGNISPLDDVSIISGVASHLTDSETRGNAATALSKLLRPQNTLGVAALASYLRHAALRVRKETLQTRSIIATN